MLIYMLSVSVYASFVYRVTLYFRPMPKSIDLYKINFITFYYCLHYSFKLYTTEVMTQI